MFVQVIQGQADDPVQVHDALDSWARELAPEASGWLGCTAGVTEDGRFIVLARFESEDAARTNSERPEQGRWWSQTSKLFTGQATFKDSSRIDVDINGNPDNAGFVQVMLVRSSNPDRSRELMAQDSADWAAFRPDIIGSVGAEHDEGAYTMALYFTSEEGAREGERMEPPPELKALMEEMDALSVGETEFLDLKQPWLYSPQ